MIKVRVSAPYASFRKSFARGYAETYPLPPPSTIYGFLLSLVGESSRRRHLNVRLAFAFKTCPRIAQTLRKLSRYKYGVPSKQVTHGNAPDYIETLCGIDFICWVDSSEEVDNAQTLEKRVVEAIQSPEKVSRYGVLALGLSDDAVDEVSVCGDIVGRWRRLVPSHSGAIELPVWVDHVGGQDTRWARFQLDEQPLEVSGGPGHNWPWTTIAKS